MKNLIVTLLCLCLSSMLSAQTTAAEYMKQVPELPDSICFCDQQVLSAFSESLGQLKETISTDAEDRNRQIEEYMQSHEGDMKANMAKNSGMTDEEIKKLESGKDMTDDEKEAMANRIMQQKANVSLDEMKNVGNLSKEGQQAWAQGYSTEQMAMSQVNPQSTSPTNLDPKSMNELIEVSNALRTKLTTMENDLRRKYNAIEQEADSEKIAMDKELKPLFDGFRGLNTGESNYSKASDDRYNALVKKISDRQKQYCPKYTPRMLAFIKEAKATIPKYFADYDQQEVLGIQLAAAQTGTKIEPKITGVYSIQAVNFYLDFFTDVFKFRIEVMSY